MTYALNLPVVKHFIAHTLSVPLLWTKSNVTEITVTSIKLSVCYNKVGNVYQLPLMPNTVKYCPKMRTTNELNNNGLTCGSRNNQHHNIFVV